MGESAPWLNFICNGCQKGVSTEDPAFLSDNLPCMGCGKTDWAAVSSSEYKTAKEMQTGGEKGRFDTSPIQPPDVAP